MEKVQKDRGLLYVDLDESEKNKRKKLKNFDQELYYILIIILLLSIYFLCYKQFEKQRVKVLPDTSSTISIDIL